MSFFSLTVNSYNQKTGAIPVSTSSKDTCPDTCPFSGHGCYAEEGPLRFHWQKVNNGKRGMSWNDLCLAIEKLPEGQIWRHNQAGDLPGKGNKIDLGMLKTLIIASHGRKGFTYTHKTEGKPNQDAILFSNLNQFTVNLSADNLKHADYLHSLNIGPIAVVLPSWDDRISFLTKRGNKVKSCPATYKETTCEECRWCQNVERNFMVGVPAHGSGVAKVDYIIEKHRLTKLF